MSEPIVFISHSRFKEEGAFDGFRELAREVFPMMEREKPGTVVYLGYTDEEHRTLDMVHVFPDADAMDRHLEGVGERTAAAFEFIETVGYELFGSPSEQALETMTRYARELGVPVTVRPQLLGGHVRRS